ncbi:hypothetical protein D3C79_530710 [compost metagenome]
MTLPSYFHSNSSGIVSHIREYSIKNTVNPISSSFSLVNSLGFNSGESINIERVVEASANKDAEKYYLEFMRIFLKDDFIEGETSISEVFLERIANEHPISFSKFFFKVWMEIFYIRKDIVLSCRFINFSASIDHFSIGSQNADVMLIAALGHDSPELNEAALRAMEFWSQPQYKAILDGTRKFTHEWLNEYKRKVAIYIERCVS